jgi:hypothetical protein
MEPELATPVTREDGVLPRWHCVKILQIRKRERLAGRLPAGEGQKYKGTQISADGELHAMLLF